MSPLGQRLNLNRGGVVGISARSRLLLVFSMVLLAAPPAVAAERGRAGPRPADAGLDVPADVPAGWWRQVQRSIQLETYGVVEAGQAGLAYRAANPAQGFDSRFDGRGLQIAGRVEPGHDAVAWEWGLSLTGWGRPGALQTPPDGPLAAREDRIELDHAVLTEWFVNTPQGLEHGFTVPEPPAGGSAPLVLDLALSGGLRPVFTADGQAVDFYGSGNVSVLRYAKLLVTDAAGTVLPARMEPIAGGIRIVVEDEGAVYPITVDPLATAAAWTAIGEAGSNNFGYSLATAGDVNADGYADVVVGAYANDENGNSAGKAYLYLGGAGGLSVAASWSALGEAASDQFGRSVATAGDVNGDGYADVVVGASGKNSSAGKTYLYLGGPGGLGEVAPWSAAGEASNNFFGFSVAPAGDVNGDGYADVVVGAFGNFNEGGKAYLYLGAPGGLSGAASWSAVGEAFGDRFGLSVAPAGDVNGDGYADVVVGAYVNVTLTGKAYLYLGGPGGLSGAASWDAPGEATGDEFAWSVAPAGDVDGDGYGDVLVGAPGNASDTGKAYLYLGSPGGLSTGTAWSAPGEAVGDGFGFSVAPAGDVNGDGYADVVVGAGNNTSDTGKAYLYLGGPSGLNTSVAWTATGEAANDRFGGSVAPAGDVNGDGYGDLVVGARGHSASTGKAYLYLGSPGGLGGVAAWSVVGEAQGDQFGQSVASAGDVNGDGRADVVVGASSNDEGGFPCT